MKTKAVRLHGAGDLRLDEFELPPITDDEILVKVISDSVCMSTYKCAILGTAHKRVHAQAPHHSQNQTDPPREQSCQRQGASTALPALRHEAT